MIEIWPITLIDISMVCIFHQGITYLMIVAIPTRHHDFLVENCTEQRAHHLAARLSKNVTEILRMSHLKKSSELEDTSHRICCEKSEIEFV